MNSWIRSVLVAAVFGISFCSCRDTASTGFLCNFTGSSIEFVMEPIDTAVYAQQISGGRVRVLSYDENTMRAELEANDDQCLWIANGVNGLNPGNLFIEYLEIRRSSGTEVHVGKEDIFDLFVEVENEVYEIQILE
jgi:hypothetical protein